MAQFDLNGPMNNPSNDLFLPKFSKFKQVFKNLFRNMIFRYGFWHLHFFSIENHTVAHQVLCYLSFPPYKCETARILFLWQRCYSSY